MATSLGATLPPELMERLTDGRLYRAGGLALTVLTRDEAGWPHVAMAPGAVAAGPQTLLLALGGATGSLRNAERDPRVTLLVAGPETLYYVKGEAAVVRREMRTIPQEAALKVSVTEVLQDMEPFLTITGGITYRYRVLHEEYTAVIGALLDELRVLAEET